MTILRFLRIIPDKQMLKLQYRIKFKRKLDLKAPRRFTEKMQWYKLFWRDSLMPVCSDKYAVRKFVERKGLSDILNELYCVFEKPSDIDIKKLPDKFVLKLSNGCKANLICRDKSKLNSEKIKRDFKVYVSEVKANSGREWPYTKSKPVIVAEKLLEDEAHINNAVNDYKIFCYGGKPTYIICVSDRYTDKCNHLVYDTSWKKISVSFENSRKDEDEPKPENLTQMLEIAAKLSKDFPFARIDLYNINGKIIFGEITFYPWSGYMEFCPDEFDFVLGEHFVLPEKKD